MSEEILKALMQLFAIISRQTGGLGIKELEYVHSFLKEQLNESTFEEYFVLFDRYISEIEVEEPEPPECTIKSIQKIKSISDKINETLSYKQKVIVLIRIIEFVCSGKRKIKQCLPIVETIVDVFKISRAEFNIIKSFINFKKGDDFSLIDHKEFLIIGNKVLENKKSKSIVINELLTEIVILKISSADLFVFKFISGREVFLNGLQIKKNKIYLLAKGSIIKTPKTNPIFFPVISARFYEDTIESPISFEVNDLEFVFKDGYKGLHNVNFSETSGNLCGIMGSNGAGKTTLLNVLCGMETPSNGEILINGINVHKEKDKLKGVIGFVPHDDMLIENLTVFENLYYNASLIFKDLSGKEIKEKVLSIIHNLELTHIKDFKVGSPLNKRISGGERKKLNISLELLREPSVLFIDEPTSGLSSRDTENVMEILREQTIKGKLVFVIIHQPASDIFKMFDSILIMDTGGYPIYFGNPINAVMYFKKKANQLNSDIGECFACGNINVENIFSIIDARTVDEFGRFSRHRKIKPKEWNNLYNKEVEVNKNHKQKEQTKINNSLPEILKIPNRWKQFLVFFKRDIYSKLSNRQYVLINLLESPIIAFIIASIVYYVGNSDNSKYIFRENDNLVAYIFTSVIFIIFLGLSVSAEEIFRDRKILKREEFLNLSRTSYLISKVMILSIISAIQSFLFVIVGNYIIGIRDMYFSYWLVLFVVSLSANMMGLNLSASFNSVVNIYIVIPFLVIPQLILAGAVFNFDKINSIIGGGKENVPIIAEFMPSKWAFEALIVEQFTKNKYEKPLYLFNKAESELNYKNVYYLPELKAIIDKYEVETKVNKSTQPIAKKDLKLLKDELTSETKKVPQIKFGYLNKLNLQNFNNEIADSTYSYIDKLQNYYKTKFNHVNSNKDKFVDSLQKKYSKRLEYINSYDENYNRSLSYFAQNTFAEKPIVHINNRLVQKIDPIYKDPQKLSYFNYCTHFLAPRKYFMGRFWNTYFANIITILGFTLILYVTLYLETINLILNFFDKIKLYILRLEIIRKYLKK
ncbi:MAG: ATP-binding cassette domain-containing protein [Bacteroidales bacterium]|jgi:ABC-type multidrug transport system ATPase subunit